jgi:SAM-dependent methyltransferase
MRDQPASVWCLDFLKIEGDCLLLDGWALAPHGAKPAFTVNGFKVSSSFGRERPDLHRVMSLDPRAPTAGFHSEMTGIVQHSAKRLFLEIQFCDEATLRPFDAGHSFYWPLARSNHALPDPARRKRVHGDVNEDGFIINGYSTFMKLSSALGDLSRGWDGFARILDWGCGCGRVFRHLPEQALGRLEGVDIDADNIEWCKLNFPGSEFHTVPLLPPSPLPSEHVDLVIGISVFTHLREPSQRAWLEELSRVSRSGALLLVSTHGPAAAARANLSTEQYEEWRAKGFLATGLNVDLGGAILDDSYYVDSLHTHDYVRRVWGEYFEVLKIYDSCIANHQDLVVMRKR